MKTMMILILFVLVIGCTPQAESTPELGDLRPMIAIDGQLFADRGKGKEMLSEEWKVVAEVEKQVAQTEPMKRDTAQVVSNTLPVGTKIYKSEHSSLLYAEFDRQFIEYEVIEES